MADSFVFADRGGGERVAGGRRVFVTGAGGGIGSYFAEHSHESYELTLSDRPGTDLGKIERFGRVVEADLSDLDRLAELMGGCDALLHLAANPSPGAKWDSVLEDNVVGTYNAFVAARKAGVQRIVYASSIHAVSGYPVDRQVHPDDPVNPGDLYGVSKCFGEALARMLAIQQGLSAVVIRIGAFQPPEKMKGSDQVRNVNAFVSQRDLNQLICRAIDDRTLQFAIVHGLSDNIFNAMDITEARELLGYEPQDSFVEINPRMRKSGLGQVKPHSEEGGQKTGLRDEL